jgi:hypothetical protein
LGSGETTIATDLTALWGKTCAIFPDPDEAGREWDKALMALARKGDLLAYGLYVHGTQAPELASLAFSRHGTIMAGDLAASKLTTHVLPPEHGKTAFARWEAEMWLGVETEKAYADQKHTVPSCHYIMNTAAQAEKQVMEIENTLEHNKAYKSLFPSVKPDKRLGWTKDHLFLARPRSRPDPSLQGCGMFGPIQGSRVGLQLVDDPTDQQDARSDGLLKSQAQWLLGTAADRVLKRGIRRYRMTRWSEKDTFSGLTKIGGMQTRVMPCLDHWGPGLALWPEVWNKERLEEKRQELIDAGQAFLWQMTWMCSPQVAEGTIFKRIWFTYGIPKLGDVAV